MHNSRKSKLILLEIQILTDIKGSVPASECDPEMRHSDGGSRGSLWGNGVTGDQSLIKTVLAETKSARGHRGVVQGGVCAGRGWAGSPQ